MPSQPPINTYHCLCTTLLLTTTHTLSSLPRRSTTSTSTSSSTLDAAIILPLSSSPPSPPSPSLQPTQTPPLTSSGYTTLHSLPRDPKPTLIRREDGFEKRTLYRCSRCRVVIGYEIVTATTGGIMGEEMDIDGGKGKEVEGEYTGKVIYLLSGGLMSTEVMMKGRKIREEDVEIGGSGVGVFE